MFNVLVIRAYIALKCLYQRLSALLRDKTAEIELPDYVLSNLARTLLTDIKVFFANEEHQVAYQRWIQTREKQKSKKPTEKP